MMTIKTTPITIMPIVSAALPPLGDPFIPYVPYVRRSRLGLQRRCA